jgi:pilus assembly protein CpaB
MRTRIIAVAVAAILAIVGAVVLVVAVRSADQSAVAGAKLTTVLVVQAAVPAGTQADHLGDAVIAEQIPAKYVAHGAVSSVDGLGGLVTTIDLQPGEQLLQSRFSSPEELASSGVHAAVPAGLQEVSIAVDLQRVAGGAVGPGDHVGLFFSFDADGPTAASTRLQLNDVLVTSVASTVAKSDDPNAQAQGLVLVTLAVSADDAQNVVYAAEFGHIWMSAQNDDTKPGTEGPVTSAGSSSAAVGK